MLIQTSFLEDYSLQLRKVMNQNERVDLSNSVRPEEPEQKKYQCIQIVGSNIYLK